MFDLKQNCTQCSTSAKFLARATGARAKSSATNENNKNGRDCPKYNCCR